MTILVASKRVSIFDTETRKLNHSPFGARWKPSQQSTSWRAGARSASSRDQEHWIQQGQSTIQMENDSAVHEQGAAVRRDKSLSRYTHKQWMSGLRSLSRPSRHSLFPRDIVIFLEFTQPIIFFSLPVSNLYLCPIFQRPAPSPSHPTKFSSVPLFPPRQIQSSHSHGALKHRVWLHGILPPNIPVTRI